MEGLRPVLQVRKDEVGNLAIVSDQVPLAVAVFRPIDLLKVGELDDIAIDYHSLVRLAVRFRLLDRVRLVRRRRCTVHSDVGWLWEFPMHGSSILVFAQPQEDRMPHVTTVGPGSK